MPTFATYTSRFDRWTAEHRGKVLGANFRTKEEASAALLDYRAKEREYVTEALENQRRIDAEVAAQKAKEDRFKREVSTYKTTLNSFGVLPGEEAVERFTSRLRERIFPEEYHFQEPVATDGMGEKP